MQHGESTAICRPPHRLLLPSCLLLLLFLSPAAAQWRIAASSNASAQRSSGDNKQTKTNSLVNNRHCETEVQATGCESCAVSKENNVHVLPNIPSNNKLCCLQNRFCCIRSKYTPDYDILHITVHDTDCDTYSPVLKAKIEHTMFNFNNSQLKMGSQSCKDECICRSNIKSAENKENSIYGLSLDYFYS